MLCHLSGWVMENVSFSTLETDNVDKYDNQCSEAYDSFPLPQLNSSKKQTRLSVSFELFPIQCTQVRSFKNKETD